MSEIQLDTDEIILAEVDPQPNVTYCWLLKVVLKFLVMAILIFCGAYNIFKVPGESFFQGTTLYAFIFGVLLYGLVFFLLALAAIMMRKMHYIVTNKRLITT